MRGPSRSESRRGPLRLLRETYWARLVSHERRILPGCGQSNSGSSTVTDPRTGRRRRTTYPVTIEEARARYVDPEPVPWSREVRQVNEGAAGHGQMLGAITRPAAG
jgi:hypothetical protein